MFLAIPPECNHNFQIAAVLEQHFPVNGKSCYYYAIAILGTRDPAEGEATSQLSLGAQSYGEELSTGHAGRSTDERGQLCHLLGEARDSEEAALRSSVPQVKGRS